MNVRHVSRLALVAIGLALALCSACDAVETNVNRCSTEDGGTCDAGNDEDSGGDTDVTGKACTRDEDCGSSNFRCGKSNMCERRVSSS